MDRTLGIGGFGHRFIWLLENLLICSSAIDSRKHLKMAWMALIFASKEDSREASKSGESLCCQWHFKRCFAIYDWKPSYLDSLDGFKMRCFALQSLYRNWQVQTGCWTKISFVEKDRLRVQMDGYLNLGAVLTLSLFQDLTYDFGQGNQLNCAQKLRKLIVNWQLDWENCLFNAQLATRSYLGCHFRWEVDWRILPIHHLL